MTSREEPVRSAVSGRAVARPAGGTGRACRIEAGRDHLGLGEAAQPPVGQRRGGFQSGALGYGVFAHAAG
ncbi:hypothetical protein ACWDE9_31135, partial [Streptomyces olivaceoviridis]